MTRITDVGTVGVVAGWPPDRWSIGRELAPANVNCAVRRSRSTSRRERSPRERGCPTFLKQELSFVGHPSDPARGHERTCALSRATWATVIVTKLRAAPLPG